MVIDAGGLFHLSKRLDLLRRKECVVTPHAGEFARLSGGGTSSPGRASIASASSSTVPASRRCLKAAIRSSTTARTPSISIRPAPTRWRRRARAMSLPASSRLCSPKDLPRSMPRAQAPIGTAWQVAVPNDRHAGVIARDIAEALGTRIPPRPNPMQARCV